MSTLKTSPLWDPLVAATLLTRLPMPYAPQAAFAHQARAAWAFPLIGLVVGGLAALVSLIGPAPAISAGLALGSMALVTGAMHEDGLADTADGLWGGQTRERRLEIMKDSRIGAYGVLALIVVIGLRWAALGAVTLPALITAAILSRSLMPALMAWLPHARVNGLSSSVGAPSSGIALLALGLGLALSLLLVGGAAFKAALAGALIVTTLAAIARHKIGGQTGDILGAAQQLSEAAILIALIS